MSGPVAEADAPTPDHRPGEPVPEPCLERSPSRLAEVGGIPVRRALPRRQRRTVGAWCFVDHFGSADAPGPDDPAMGIGPHPHIGLQTVTWLLRGEALHRDSLGSEQPIRPGQLNVMTAGRGLSHSEETVDEPKLTQHGAQLWVALPDRSRHTDPAFEHHADLPTLDLGGVRATVMVGELGGERSGATTFTPLVGLALHGTGDGPASITLDPDYEHAIVVLDGSFDIGGETVVPGELAYLGRGRDSLPISAQVGAEALLLGGEPFGEEILMWWNFVARTADEVAEARRDWEASSERFGTVASPLGRIPAPEHLPR